MNIQGMSRKKKNESTEETKRNLRKWDPGEIKITHIEEVFMA